MSHREPVDAARVVIEIKAKATARAHGLDPQRVLRVFQRTAKDAHGDPLPDLGDVLDTLEHSLSFSPSLDHALQYLGGEAALILLESEDLEALNRRLAVTHYLLSPGTPLWTLDELANLTTSFIEHLEQNREHLVATGHPRTSFSRAPWLNRRLSSLYYVRHPLTVRAFEGKRGDYLYVYTWPEKPLTGDFHPTEWDYHLGVPDHIYWAGPSFVFGHSDLDPIGACPYAEAALIDGLDPHDAERLEAARERLFGLKLAVLRRLAQAIVERDAGQLWPACLALLTDAITADDAEFLLRLDRHYIGFDIRTGQRVPIEQAWHLPAGGLTDLLEVIGHCEKELTVGTMGTTKRRLMSLVDLASVASYFQVAQLPLRASFDAALEGFFRIELREAKFWSEYQTRVNRALSEDFFEEVVIRTKVRRKFTASFEPQIRSFTEWQASHLEAAGVLPQLLIAPVGGVAAPDNAFRRDGPVWTLSFQGRSVPLPASSGLQRLAVLLQQQGREISAVDLVRAADRAAPDASWLPSATTGGQAVAEGLSVGGLGNAGPILLSRDKDELYRQIQQLRARGAQAEHDDDRVEVERIQADIDALLRYIETATGFGGRNREVAAADERARKAAGNSIRRSIRTIERDHRALGEHLRTYVKERDGTFIYDPPAPMLWSFTQSGG